MIRDTVDIPDEASDPLQLGFSYGQSDLFLGEIIARLDHVNPVFNSDNASVYSIMEEASRGTFYAPTIKSYTRKNNGRAAWKAMVSSHSGQDKWEQLHKEELNILMQNKCNGRFYSLENFVRLQRNSFVQIQEVAEHVKFQLRTNHSGVWFLIDNTSNSYTDLRAGIDSFLLIQTICMMNLMELRGFYSQCAHIQSIKISVVVVPVIDRVPIYVMPL